MATQNVNLRPLSQGMITNVASNQLPSGSFLDVMGFIVRNGKLRLRPRFTNANTYSAYDRSTYGPAVDVLQYPNSVSDLTNLVLTESSILEDIGSALSPVEVTRAAGATYVPFTYNSLVGNQYTVGRDEYGTAIWFTDGSNPVVKYGGAASPVWEETNFLDEDGVERTDMTSPRSICWHDSRLYVAAPTSLQGTMLRWSNLNDPEVFDDTSYMYFPDQVQPILKLKSMGEYLVIYFPDAILFGTASGDPLLPYYFEKISGNNIGLLGPKAVIDWKNGHLMITKHGFMYLSQDAEITEIPCPIWEQIREEITSTDKYTIVTSGDHQDVYISFPRSGYNAGKLVYFNVTSNAWTYWNITGDTIAISTPLATLAWDNGSEEFVLPDGTIIATWADFETAGISTWGDLARFVNPLTVILLKDGYIYSLSDDYEDDSFGSGGTPFLLETGDFDMDDADMIKTINKLKMRTTYEGDGEVVFNIEGSNDGGRTWKDLGDINVTGDDEGKVDFRMTGAEIRLRISGAANVIPFDFRDLSFRVSGRGLEAK